MLKFQISFKILKELVADAYDQFLKDLKGNLKLDAILANFALKNVPGKNYSRLPTGWNRAEQEWNKPEQAP